MKLHQLLLFALLAFQLVHGTSDEKTIFKQWLANHHKAYFSSEEYETRFEIFKNNLQFVLKHNSEFHEGLQSYEVELNKFSDLTAEEFASSYLGQRDPPQFQKRMLKDHNANNFSLPNNLELPLNFNWKDHGAVSHVQDQSGCGCCYAFAAAGAVEGCIAIKTKTLTALSKQNIVDCATDGYKDNGCKDGNHADSIRFVIDQGGLDTEKAYPYQAQKQECKMKEQALVGIVKDYMSVTGHNETILQQMVSVGPVASSISIDDGFRHYKRGVYVSDQCSSKTSNHAVLVVGWGVDIAGQEYWIVKNSFGADWGQDGFIKMARNRNNMCRIASHLSLPICS